VGYETNVLGFKGKWGSFEPKYNFLPTPAVNTKIHSFFLGNSIYMAF